MAGPRAALLPLVLQLTSLAQVSVTGGGKSGRRSLGAGAVRGPRFSLSAARGKELGPGCLSRPPPRGAERLRGQSRSSPSVEEPAWGRARRLRPGAQETGGFLHCLGRHFCRQQWGRGCPGIRESEVNYLS